jgi:hypothetical protein
MPFELKSFLYAPLTRMLRRNPVDRAASLSDIKKSTQSWLDEDDRETL